MSSSALTLAPAPVAQTASRRATEIRVLRFSIPQVCLRLTDEEYSRLVNKKIFFIRHAESSYQLSSAPFTERCVDERLRDTSLTPRGRIQAMELGHLIHREVGINNVDLIVTSPLTRSMQTAALAFGGASNRTINVNPLFAEKVDSWNDVERDISECVEEHVELRGFIWHRTRSRHCLQATGHPISSSWNLDKGYPFERESTAMDRIIRAWRWLCDREEKNIVIITHSKLLGRESAAYGLLLMDPLSSLSTFDNCEVCAVSFHNEAELIDLALIPRPVPSPVASRYAIVILGAALTRNGSPSYALLDRIHAAVQLYNSHKSSGAGVIAPYLSGTFSPQIIVSGGDPSKIGVTEAQCMRNLLIDYGIPESLILEDRMSQNTCQNAWFVGQMLRNATGITLITSDFHMPRSKYIFEAVFTHLGLSHVDISALSAVSGCSGEKISTSVVRESIAREQVYIARSLVPFMLTTCIPDVVVPPLPEERFLRAKNEIDTLLAMFDARNRII
jgi:broad specificity phosphatase PhoE/uncharacterized SAM-binding protein YcdF (DUF218 family)